MTLDGRNDRLFTEIGINFSELKFLGRYQLHAAQDMWIKFYYRLDPKESGSYATEYNLFMELEPVVSPHRYPYNLYMKYNWEGSGYSDSGYLPNVYIKWPRSDADGATDPEQWSESLWSAVTISDSNKSGTLKVNVSITNGTRGTPQPSSADKVNAQYEFLLQDNSALSSLTIGDGELGAPMSITVTRFNSTYNHTVAYVDGEGNTYGIVIRSTETALTWTPPERLAAMNTIGSNIRMKILIYSYDAAGTYLGTRYYYINLRIPESIKPTLSLTVDDPAGLLQRYGDYIQTKSKARATFTITEAYGAGIISSEMQVGTQWTKVSPYDFSLDTAGNISVIGRAKDTRNHEAFITVPITVIPYRPPRITDIDRYRCNADGTPNGEGSYACVVFSADVSPINNQNSANYKIQIREQGASDWTDHALPSISGNYAPSNISFIFEASPTVSYEIRAGAADDFSEKFSGVRQIPTAAALLEVDATGTGMAIGQMAKEPGVLRVNLPAFFNHDVSITGDIDAENVKFGIIESGVSGDSLRRYVKFADGTLVNWGKTVSTELPINTAFYSLFRSSVQSWTFLAPFFGTEISVIVNGSTRYGSMWAAVTEITCDRLKYQLLDFESRSSGINVMVNFIAIGRWR